MGRQGNELSPHSKKDVGPEERRERRKLRREKQREENIGRAEKMHLARLAAKEPGKSAVALANSAFVGCSGWFYWKWRGNFYPAEMPTSEWFNHYATQFDTVEINASFYSWPTVANVKSWLRQPGSRKFVYTIKVCELITHIKRFEGTDALVEDFGMIADILGDRMGCFLFQLPPSFRFTDDRLKAILGQLDHNATQRGGVSSRQLVERDGLFRFSRDGHDILLLQWPSASRHFGSHGR